MDSRREYMLGVVFISLSMVAWSLTGFFTRLVALDSLTIIAWRGIFGSVSLVGVAMLLRGKAWHREFTSIGRPELFYIANTMFGTFTLITAYAHTSVAHCAVIYATIPFMAAFLGWFLLAEVPSGRALLTSLIALAGVGLMVAVGTDGGMVGDLLALAMTMSTALSIVLIRKYPQMSAIGSSSIAVLLASIVAFPFASAVDVGPHGIFLLALFGIVNSALGLALFALGSRRLPAVEVALISAVDTPLAMVWVWLAFDEQPGWSTILGGIIVLSAVVVHVLVEARRSKALLDR